MSFKVIGTDTDRYATYDFLLVSIVTMGLSRTVSVENHQFFPPSVFYAPADWVTLGIEYRREGTKN